MEYFDLWDSRMIKSLRLPTSGNQLRFLIQRVPSGRISNVLSIPPPEVIASVDEVVAPELAESFGSPSSTTVDQDAPSLNKSQTILETQPHVIPHDVEEDNHDIEVEHMGNDPLFGMPIPEVVSDQSSSTVSSHTIVRPDYQIPQQNSKWTKDHPLDNIIGQLSRPVSTRLQLHEQALFCYYDAFLTSVEPKTYKDALTQSWWIEAMQEELNKFERLELIREKPPRVVPPIEAALFQALIITLQSFVIFQAFNLSLQKTWPFLVTNGIAWDCQVGCCGGRDNKPNGECFVAAGGGDGCCRLLARKV
nr:retrovirus-related Pol polyprotein from transposon TNT 1-94 [Tanacetum cinerariifolium]